MLATVVAVTLALSSSTQDPQAIAIEHVTVLDATAPSPDEARIPDQTVVVVGDRIRRVSPAGTIAVPTGALRVDGSGKFLISGFWDMHVHFNREPLSRERVMGPLMIAHGVTSARDMLSDCWEPCRPGRLRLSDMRALQRRISEGEVLAPRLQALSSPIVHGPKDSSGYPAAFPSFWQPRTESDGRRLARFLAERGVDVIKTYHTIPRAAYWGLLDEARALGVPVAGHHPWSVDLIEAAQHGVRSIEHARWPAFACNAGFEAFRPAFESFATGDGVFPQDLFTKWRDASTAAFQPERCARIFEALAVAETYLDPTHLTREMDARAADSSYRADSRRAYVPPWILRGWDRDLSRTASGPPELLEFYRDFFALGLRVTGTAHAQGVKVLVGTDAFDTMVFPGFSYHDELAHLARAGLSPLDILRAATYRGAEFLGKTEDYGTVAEGKVADLVLLTADPLVDIAHTTQIAGVLFNGTLYDRAALDAMIQGVRDFVGRAGR